LELLFLAAIATLSLIGTIKGKIEGIITEIALGTYIFTFGIATFLNFGKPRVLSLGRIRVLLTIIFRDMPYKEIKKMKIYGRDLSN
jgi:hypothetical protein